MSGQIGDTDRYGEPTSSVQVSVGSETRIVVGLPYTFTYADGAGATRVPFVLRFGYGAGQVSVHIDRADLTRLRDTITEALDAEQAGES